MVEAGAPAEEQGRDADEPIGTTLRTITEMRTTCSVCGNVWYYGKAELLGATEATFANAAKTMLCCAGCFPALLIPNKKVLDLDKCPKCGSHAVKQERVEHEVP